MLLSLAVLLAGLAVGHPVLVVGTAAAAYIGWQVANLWKLYRWVRNPGGEVPQSFGLWADIYDNINMMDVKNRQQKSRFQTIINEFASLTNAFPDATLTINQHDMITWFNDAAERLLELKNPSDLGQPVTNLLRGPDFADWLAVQGGLKSPLDMPLARGKPLRLTVSAFRFREDHRLIVLRDTTEIYNLEKIRRDFVANISHELRTPLTVVQGYLELLDEHPSGDVAEVVSKMLAQTSQMQSLLDDLLELSRVQSGEPRGNEEIVNVGAMLMQLKEQAQELSRGQHELVFDFEANLCLTGIATDLESAFGNLISNAVKYTPEGGRISVNWYRGEDGPVFQVADNGIGIPRSDLPRVTERFYRVGADRGRRTGGTGLGLAIVKHVLNAHQAKLHIDSELGEGSTFTVTFPEKRARNGDKGNAEEDFQSAQSRL